MSETYFDPEWAEAIELRIGQDVPLDLRFWSRVTQVESGCWLWTGALFVNGYGHLQRARGEHHRAHVYAFQQLRGLYDPGLRLDHLCHGWDESCPGGFTCVHRRCVNVLHLEPVTDVVNNRRGRRWSGRG